jgi:predicted O-methyltransferase YrrM
MLEELFNKYGCDKARKHTYHTYYETLLKPYKNKAVSILEVGVFKGDSTLALREYLPKAKLYGVDLFERVTLREVSRRLDDQVKFAKCDSMSNTSVLEALVELGSPMFDIIIDDGAHWPEANRKTLNNFIPFLKPGGTYVIEDVWPFHKMSMEELNHHWLLKYPQRYNQMQHDMMVRTIEGAKELHNLTLVEHDFRHISKEPDSYILELKKAA